LEIYEGGIMHKLRLSKFRDHVRVSYNTWGFKGMLKYYGIYLYQEMRNLRISKLAIRITSCTNAVISATWGMWKQAGFLSAFWFVCPLKIVTVLPGQGKYLLYFSPYFERICGQWVYCQKMNPKKLLTLRKPKSVKPVLDPSKP